MLRKLRIQKFKAWADTGYIRLAPITVLFGGNSAGKSSVSQFLLSLKQTVESPDRKRVLHLGDRNSLVDLGTFRDVIFNHDEDSELQLELAFDLDQPKSVRDAKSDKEYTGSSIDFSVNWRMAGRRLIVHRLKYRLGDPQETGFAVSFSRESTARSRYRLEADNYSLVRNKGRGWPLPEPVKFYKFPDEATAYYQNTGFLDDLALWMEQTFDRMYYLGPLREYPARSYIWSGEHPSHVGLRGDRAIEALLAGGERQISAGYMRKYRPLQEVVARWLRKMGLISEFEVRPIAQNRKEYEVVVSSYKGGSSVNLPDVGFGVSQVLPVIVQCFYAPRASTVIFEQPEIHLHPSVQASLADLFIEAMRSKEDGEERANQFIIESHSEHFLRRLQRRIAEEEIKNEDVAIYFCEQTPSGARLRELEIDIFGNITNWPEHFFGDEIGDLAAMTTAAMRRQSKDTND
ncbi:MAG: DUF3696 domain-containing protein [Spiribacter salinus]|uniref:DUF3696 domain-containing protein n=1 Tax=Spiribacter salinus TaxID=1335746 RepID=A0A540VSF9_9GAMM|nr:MAG: DUF3696 domain-containing protein [Spiribacter salinus]